MRHPLFFLWLTRVLALVGIIALLILAIQWFNTPRPLGMSDYYESALSVSPGIMAESKMIVPGSPELLRDESFAQEIDQKVIKTGNLSLVVDDAIASSGQIANIATQKSGYVSNSSIDEYDDGTHSGYVTIRVPADQFENTMMEIKNDALVVENESVSTQDVTEQYIDLSARLKNAKAQEVRYIEILSVAKTVEEMLQIENALAQVRATIESLTGQIQYLDSQTDFSTISINLSEEPVVTVGGKVFRPITTIKQAAQAVVSLAQWIVNAVIWIVIVGVGVGVPLVLIGWLIWKSAKKVVLKMSRHKRV